MRISDFYVYLISVFVGFLLFLLYLFVSSKISLGGGDGNKNFDSSLKNKNPSNFQYLVTNPPKKVYFLNSQIEVSAKSYLVYDLISEREVASLNKEMTLPPASLVKMISALIFYNKLDLNERYTIDKSCTEVDGQKVGFFPNEKVSGKDLLNSSLIFSGADSVCQMQKSLGLSIADLNFFAQNTLEMKSSSFSNMIGLDSGNSYTTASDFLKATKYFLKNKTLSEIVKVKDYLLEKGVSLKNTNRLLFEIPNSSGVKTGTTFLARENLIYRYTDFEKDQDFLIVILNSGDRYTDAKKLLYAISN